jgi:hypothetical protein
MGVDLNSDDLDNYYSLDKKRLKNIELVIGEKIKSTDHYLTLTGFDSLWFLLTFFIPLNLKFYWLIIRNK